MTDPYEILGLPLNDSDDDAIRRRYLDLVKQFSPEHHPENSCGHSPGLRQIQKDLDTRLRYRLFEAGKHESIEALIEELQCRTPRRSNCLFRRSCRSPRNPEPAAPSTASWTIFAPGSS